VERIAVGGGLRASRVGELVIGRSSVLLKQGGQPIDLVPIHHHPDEAGLVGAVHLPPAWMLAGHEGLLAVDIGGSNIRAGIVHFQGEKKPDGTKCEVPRMELWRYADETDKPSREDVVARLVKMLDGLTSWAKKNDLKLAPFVGIACPGIIAADGHIERGGQNLPGNWESSRFNLPRRITDAVSEIGDAKTIVMMHNDAVVQGLSEVPYMNDVEHWGVLTIGTGLGNATFTNARRARGDASSRE
jgi:predicted NBD/HSP70 family sugar kinase